MPPSKRITRTSARVESPEVPLQRPPRQLGDLPGDLDAGRTATDHDERQPRLAQLGIVLQLGHLERAEDPRPLGERVGERLHPRRPLARTRRARNTTGRRPPRRSGCRTAERDAPARPADARPAWHRGRSPSPRPSRPRRSCACAGRRAWPARPAPRRGFRSRPGTGAAGTGDGSCGRPGSPRPARAARNFAANSPPKPEPTITTRWARPHHNLPCRERGAWNAAPDRTRATRHFIPSG